LEELQRKQDGNTSPIVQQSQGRRDFYELCSRLTLILN
jgi:hypothetical protein